MCLEKCLAKPCLQSKFRQEQGHRVVFFFLKIISHPTHLGMKSHSIDSRDKISNLKSTSPALWPIEKNSRRDLLYITRRKVLLISRVCTLENSGKRFQFSLSEV